MIPILCVDDSGGTMFNHRRLSQDRLLRQDVLAMAHGRRLWMNAYSLRQFQSQPEAPITVDEDFLAKAGPGELCFVEGLPLLPHMDRIEAVILYRWNRRYPADTYFDLPLSTYRLRETKDFPGSSHKTITKEIYTP